MNNLKPCQCGADPSMISPIPGAYQVVCTDYSQPNPCRMQTGLFLSAEAAAACWDSRPLEQAARAEMQKEIVAAIEKKARDVRLSVQTKHDLAKAANIAKGVPNA